MDSILIKILSLPGIIVGLSFHEAAHAYVSHKLGDPTPKAQGRLTLNPLAHIDVIGFIALLLCGFGWGKPVMIDNRYYRRPRRDEFLVSIAGVVTNLALAIVLAGVSGMIYKSYLASHSQLMEYLFYIFFYAMTINLCLMVFNLIPVPPLDGWGIVTQLFNLRQKSWYYNLYKYGSVILILLVFLNVTDYILTPGISIMSNLLMSIFF
ncbi:MAG: site-2 protease family protein [Firmicutes bacterium]|nr:site-2 protease family protein [Bacillota bacterium]